MRRYPKPEILTRLPKGAHAVIEASAGTGKTYTLEHLILDLVLERGVPLERILVVTFTEKATLELRTRVREKFAELLTYEGDADPARSWLLDDAARARIKDALANFDAATISTIHAFCQRVLAENAFASGRLFDEEQVEGREVFASVFRDALRAELARDEESRQWLQAALGHTLSIPRLEGLLFGCARERGQLRPRFDAEAARRAAAEYPCGDTLLAEMEAEHKQAGTHGSTRNALMDRFRKIAACVKRYQADGDLPRLLAAYDALWEEKLYEYRAKSDVGPASSRLMIAFDALDAALGPFHAAVVQMFLPRVRERLERRKRESGLFDFDDMLLLVDAALAGPRGPELARSIRSRYDVALIDEFQDTDDVQWRIFRTLFFAPGHALYLVGDPKQAIYAFRGADVHTYLRAKEHVTAEGGHTVPLEQNFRSTRPLIAGYNAILDQSADLPFFTGAIRYEAPVRCGNGALALVEPAGHDVTPVHLLRFPAGQGLRKRDVVALLGARIAREIRTLLETPIRFGPRHAPEPLRAGDIFILTRTTDEGLDLADYLRREGIPYAFFRQEGLFQTEEASHIRDLLASLADPENESKRLKAWLTPFFGVPLDALARAAEVAAEYPIAARLASWTALADEGAFERLFATIVEESGLLRRQIVLAHGERELTNYLHLFELLLEHATARRATVGELVADLDAFIAKRRAPPGENGNVQRIEGDGDAVQIMTMHKAKGLEAAVVFVAGGFSRPFFEPDVFHDGETRVRWVGRQPPSIEGKTRRESREEDQRLFYVALTRAKGRLYLPLFEGERRTDFVPDGSYAGLNDRLRDMPKPEDLFSIEDVTALEGGAASTARPRAQATVWAPPARLLTEAEGSPTLAGLKARYTGPTVTSYSRMRGEVAFEATGVHEPAPADDLPGGVTTGLFLHALLEKLDLAKLAAAESPEAWCALPEASALAASLARAHGLDPVHVPRALLTAYTALRAPVLLGEQAATGGIVSAARLVREMEFVYPIGAHVDPGEGLSASAPSPSGEAFVKGFVDVLFEVAGRVYVLDWKSDRLPSFDPAALRAHVEHAYALQVRIYTLAALKLLGITSEEDYAARFGGIVYAFVRGQRLAGTGTEGIDFRRPTWAETRAWEAELSARGAVVDAVAEVLQ